MIVVEPAPEVASDTQPEPRARADESGDDFSRLEAVLQRELQSAAEVRRFADEVRDTDQELFAFFERCAHHHAEQATEAQRLLASRATPRQAEVATSAAFAAGDGATDADVAPGSERRSVRVWPAQ